MSINDGNINVTEREHGGIDNEAFPFVLHVNNNDVQKSFKQPIMRCVLQMMNVGTVSNIITFFILILGCILAAVYKDMNKNWHAWLIGRCIRALGLFGFAGGITNWLAVKMLFDRIPGLIGSGIITKQFKEIRESVKNVILNTFFDTEFLEPYIHRKADELIDSFEFEQKINDVLQSPLVDRVLDDKLNDLAARPEGMMLRMMGVTPESLKPLIKPFVSNLGSDILPILKSSLAPGEMLDVKKIREQVDILMSTKLLELTPQKVKKLMESMIREHLGWLIVWGNVFGGFIGLITEVASSASAK